MDEQTKTSALYDMEILSSYWFSWCKNISWMINLFYQKVKFSFSDDYTIKTVLLILLKLKLWLWNSIYALLSDGCSTGYERWGGRISWNFLKFFSKRKIPNLFLTGHTKDWGKRKIVLNTNACNNQYIDPNELNLGL